MNLDYNIVIGGKAGQGLQTISDALSKLFLRGGYEVFTSQDYMSRVRGGHNFFMIRVSDRPVSAQKPKIDLLIALDQETIDLHWPDLEPEAFVFYDGESIHLSREDKRLVSIPWDQIASTIGGNTIFANTIAVGACCGLLNFDLGLLAGLLQEAFAKKDPKIVETNLKCAKAGYELTKNLKSRITIQSGKTSGKMYINGSEAIGLGAIASGVKFYSGYPMTPSTGILNYLAGKSDEFGIVVEQAEDEIAAINFVAGASFAGVRAMTATSGGGFCLMTEGVSLIGCIETPAVLVLGQRPGPSTGLPTRTEQGDLEFALSAGQGEFPRFIFAPRTPEDAFYLTQKAFNLADKYQVLSIIMSDQHLADSGWTLAKFDPDKIKIERYLLNEQELAGLKEYRRYDLSETGVSPRTIPGASRHLVIADSDEHDRQGHITEDLHWREEIVKKRLVKYKYMQEEISLPIKYGDNAAETVLIGWGSTYGAMKEAVDLLNAKNRKVAMLHFNELWPLPVEYLSRELSKYDNIVAVENNATAQFMRIISGQTGILSTHKILRFNGQPFYPQLIVDLFQKEVITYGDR
ncbi:MAG: 2-oxoacid:acceptor oxidoreductase subunit alpha [bacterium]|nr:2-oxoacid:acceptor oxidoreductase subunit alpha [bacterium]MDD5354265.1 2-oxoacid:acceptor oxidoreductase subunit alpha [bacterium]MDD5756379.1 2-oxoacid:acceptor oxidoreductase subunit alpha [bacterium]